MLQFGLFNVLVLRNVLAQMLSLLTQLENVSIQKNLKKKEGDKKTLQILIQENFPFFHCIS